jgi:acyl-CoA thioester hydrolase
MPFVHRHRVRYHECDPQGIVFNANYFTFFDVALTEWFREAFGSYGTLKERGSDIVLAETTARFHGPARFDDELEIAIAVERLGTTSMVVTFTSTGIVEGRTVYVFVDPATMAKQPIPEWAREGLAPYLSEP